MVDVTGSAVAYTSYIRDSFRGNIFAPETDTVKMALAGTNYTPSKAHTDIADITDEMTGNGYTQQTLTNVLIVESGGWINLTFDPVQFSAVGGNLVPEYWVLYNDRPGPSGPLMFYGRLNVNESGPIVLIGGQTLDIVVNELGLWRIAA